MCKLVLIPGDDNKKMYRKNMTIHALNWWKLKIILVQMKCICPYKPTDIKLRN